MNWLHVADWIRSKTCHEQRGYGTCKCVTKRGNCNPCERAIDLVRTCEQLESGDSVDVESVLAWAKKHRCHNHETCNHRGCINAAPIIDFIYALVLACCFATVTVDLETNTDCGVWLNGVRAVPGEPTFVPCFDGEEVEIEIRYINGDSVESKKGYAPMKAGERYKLQIQLQTNPPTVVSI